MVSTLFSLKNLSFSYDGKKKAIEDINLDIYPNKKTVFVGSNGSGKSTIFLLLVGLLKPDQGKIFYKGEELKYDNTFLKSLRSEVSLVFQNPEHQIFCTTVEEDVAFGPLNLSLPREEVEKRVENALKITGLEDLRDAPISNLSFGQKKRVAIAGALAMEPKAIVLDEPTAGLDIEMVHELLELFEELVRDKISVILSTHDIETLWEWADDLVVLNKGKVLYTGDVQSFYLNQDKIMHQVGISPPLSFQLNFYLHERKKTKLLPFPRSYVELIEKLIPAGHKKTGQLTIVLVDKKTPQEISNLKVEHNKTGVVGSYARKLAKENLISVHHKFHAIENALLEIRNGNDFVLFSHSSLLDFINDRISSFEKFSKIKAKIKII